MNRKRDYIRYEERLAAALSRLLPPEQEKELREKRVPAKAIISLFQNDHIVLHALGGSDKWFNLDPKIIAPHREKSRRDTSIVAKVRRIEKEPEKWRGLSGPKTSGKTATKSRTQIPSRPFRSASRLPGKGQRPFRRKR